MADAEKASPEVLAIRDRMIQNDPISWDEVVAWTRSGDVELEGAAFEAIMAPEPPLVGAVDADVANEFLFRYLLAALVADGEPAPIFGIAPYVAAHQIAEIYKGYSRRGYASGWLEKMRDELARLYVSGDERLQKVVVHGVVEHVFEEPMCRSDFEAWKRHPQLRKAFSEALEWGEWFVARHSPTGVGEGKAARNEKIEAKKGRTKKGGAKGYNNRSRGR